MKFHGLATGHPLDNLVIGANAEQGFKCFEYVSGFWQQPEYNQAVGRNGILKQTVTLPDGTKFKIATATMKATNGPHPPRFYADELELWDPKVLQQALSIAKGTQHHPMAMRFTSSQKFASGLVQKWLDEMPARGWKVYTWCIWEIMEPCPPERSCSRCPLYNWPDHEGGILCGGKARLSTGYYRIDDFINMVDSLDRQTLEAEWLCLRPSRKGLVFGREWQEARHRLTTPIPYSPNLPLELSIDQGFTNPWAVLFIQHDAAKDQHRLIDEIYMTETLAEEIGAATANKLEAHGVGTEQKITAWADPEDPGAARTWARHLVSRTGRRYNVVLRNPGIRQDILDYLQDVRVALKIPRNGRPRTIVGAGVINFPLEMNSYHYPDGSDARTIAEAPVDKYNHAISAFYRYLVQFRPGAKARAGKDPRRR